MRVAHSPRRRAQGVLISQSAAAERLFSPPNRGRPQPHDHQIARRLFFYFYFVHGIIMIFVFVLLNAATAMFIIILYILCVPASGVYTQ